MTMTADNSTDLKDGRVVAIAGPVVDVEFPPDEAQEAHRDGTEGVADALRTLGGFDGHPDHGHELAKEQGGVALPALGVDAVLKLGRHEAAGGCQDGTCDDSPQRVEVGDEVEGFCAERHFRGFVR